MKRVVVTGMGTVNPLGNSVESTWQAIREGRSGVTLNDRFDVTDYDTKIAGLVKEFKASDFMDRKDARKMALFTQYGVAATRQAVEMAGLKEGSYEPHRVGVVIGNGIGGFEIIEASLKSLFDIGPSRVPPMTIPKMIINEAVGNIAIAFNCQGPAYSVVTACASGSDAIGNAKMLIESGMADVAITGGTEGAISKLGIAGFNSLQALSTGFNDCPEKASRPFDKDRDGFVMAEGAGILILESEEHATARGATILAEVAGYGITCDANHLTAPHPEGLGASKAMDNALASASMQPGEIDYLNAHGTSTPTNDPLETLSIKRTFGEHAGNLKISSTKSMTGHLVGAAGGVEAIISILAIRDGYAPPTINLDQPDEACDLDYTPNVGVEMPIDAVMSNSLGFGGHNGVIIMRRYRA